MSRAAARYLSITADTLFGTDPEAHALVTGPDGSLLAGGEEARNVALADVLDDLATNGPALFSAGRSVAASSQRWRARRAGHR